MSYLEKLKKFIIERSLIQSKSDIDFLFVSYEYDEKKPLDEIINDVIEWGYNNDELKDFYSEHWGVLQESESIIRLQGCDMTTQFISTSFVLFKHNSKNKYYYKIKSYGECADLIDTNNYFEVLDHQDDDSIIDDFKNVCYEGYTDGGRLDDEDLNSSSLEFYE